MKPIFFTRKSESAVVPKRHYKGDVGWDLYLSRDLYIPSGAFADAHVDLEIALPEGYWGMLTGRSSSTRKHGILVLTGIIDNGYRGPLHIACQNIRNDDYFIPTGARIAQLIISEIHDFEWFEVTHLPPSDRGDRGFGSSGT